MLPVTMARRRAAIERILTERSRQEELKRAGRFPYTLADPDLTLSQKVGKILEELAEANKCVQWLEGTAYNDFEPGTPEAVVMSKLKEEVTQVAALALAWLEGLGG